MGSGQSALSQDDILAQAKQYYKDNPEGFEDLYRKVKEQNNNNNNNNNKNNSATPTQFGQSSEPATVGCFTSKEESSFSNQIAAEMTLLRENPSAYAVYIEQHLQTFLDDLTFKRDNQDFLIKTKEGKKAVEECISALRNQDVLCPIDPSELLEMASLTHQRDTSKNNLLGHTGSDSSTPQERVERYCVWRGIVGENIDYGNNTARDVKTSLLIDDGVPTRGHRDNLLNPEFKMVGSAVGPHAMYGCCCVMNLATSVKSLNSIVSSDCEVTCKGGSVVTEEIIKILESMPVDKDQVQNMINEKLTSGMDLAIRFNPSNKSCEFVFTMSGGSATQTITWE